MTKHPAFDRTTFIGRFLLTTMILSLGACDPPLDDEGDIPVDAPDGTCNAEDLGFCVDYWGEVDMFEQVCAGEWSTTEPCMKGDSCGKCFVDAGDFMALTFYFDGSGVEATSEDTCEAGAGIWIDHPGHCQ